jgi:hypothetical protein
MAMNAIGNVLVWGSWLERELETLLFVTASALLAGGTIVICLSV